MCGRSFGRITRKKNLRDHGRGQLRNTYVMGLWEKKKGSLRGKYELTGGRELRSQNVVSVVEEDDPRETERWNRGDESRELLVVLVIAHYCI